MRFSIVREDRKSVSVYPEIVGIPVITDDEAVTEKMKFTGFEFLIKFREPLPSNSGMLKEHIMAEKYSTYGEMIAKVGHPVRTADYIEFFKKAFGDDITVVKI